jgi:hypothetical protein
MTDVILKSRMHVLVGFHDHDTTMLGGVSNLSMNLGASGVSAGAVHYAANVICG